MSNTSRISLTSKRTSVQNRIASAAIILFQLLIALCYALSLIFAFDWLRKPFIGAFVEHTLTVNTITPSRPDTWELNMLGLPFGYQVVSINDQKLQSPRQLNELLTHYQSGEFITLNLRAPEGNLAVHKITLQNFPYADRLEFRFVPYFIGLVYLGCSLWVFRQSHNNDAGRAYALLTASLALALTVQRRFTSESRIVREQARLVLWGFGFTLAPIAAWRLITYWNTVQFTPYQLLPLRIFPVITGYAILRYRFLNTEYIFSRAVLYTLLSILAASGYAILVSGLSLITGNILPSNHLLLIGLMVFIFALLLHPFRTRLQQRVDAIFFRGRTVFQDRLQTFRGELTEVMDMSALVNRLREYISQSLFPSPLHIFIYDPLSDLYIATS